MEDRIKSKNGEILKVGPMNENLLEVIKEELNRLGLQGSLSDTPSDTKKSLFYQNGSKFIGLSNNPMAKSKPKSGFFFDSPKGDRKLNQASESSKTPKSDFSKIKSAKSPFSSKNKMERKSGRKKEALLKKLDNSQALVFGCDLESLELCSAYLEDGTLVSVPRFIVDVCNLIRKNAKVEGIFRKAGSAQRQNEIKALLNSGLSLPSGVHPIDAACLLKQFLRQLPTPLLTHHIHFLMTRCLELPKEEQLEALSLCSLLLNKYNQDLLVYILELLAFVASSSQENLMDSHNLAIVLAPNLLPTFSKGSSGKKAAWGTDDLLLESTIDVIQLLIDGSSAICRLTERLNAAVQKREKSQSLENLADAPSSGNPKKKRRSASIHRIVNSLRRVVQGGPLVQTPASQASPLKSSTPFAQNRLGEISMEPDIEMSKYDRQVKRKSDTFEPLHGRDEKRLSLNQTEPDRPKKKAKIELKSAKAELVLGKMEQPINQKGPHSKNMAPICKSSKSLVSIKEKNSNIVKRRYSLREKVGESRFVERDSENEGSSLARRKSLIGSSVKKTTQGIELLSSISQIKSYSSSPRSGLQPRRGRSFNARGSEGGAQTSGRHFQDNRPVGSEDGYLGPRGVPDGAESNLRDSPIKSPCSKAIKDLEEKYDNIKSVVKIMEDKIDNENLSNMKESQLSFQILGENKSVSCTQLVCDAYERMEKEMKDMEYSPAENLSRRLGRELRIRSRRSDEHRVLRSPSERKIGSIRRRSKELEQNLAKQNENCDSKAFTPRFKGVLLPSPQASLRRGKPNSLKSGLPVIVKPQSAINKRTDLALSSNKVTPSKTVCIYKRKSPSANSVSSDSITMSTNSLEGVLCANYSGPMTRRRSSIISSLSNPLPSFNLNSEENSFEVSFKSLSGVENKSKDCVNFEETKGSSSLGCKDLSESEMEWVSATKFMKDVKHSDGEENLSSGEQSGNRPSIAALKEQKKVTSNVQLFSQLQDKYVGPSRQRSTPNNHPSLRSVNSSSCGSRKHVTVDRSSSTPAEVKIIGRSKRRNSNMTKMLTSPLKDNNHQSCEASTPRIISRERRLSRVKRTETFIVSSGLTPLPPRPYKPPHLLTPKENTDTPPRIPPKSISLSCKRRSLSRNFR